MGSVALRKESVDRNTGDSILRIFTDASLSARRAWIEIRHLIMCRQIMPVALRKESVDRNREVLLKQSAAALSLSARRAWIEIKIDVGWWSVDVPSLSARRAWIEMEIV